MKLFIKFFLLLFCWNLALNAAEIPKVLKQRQPHWRPKIFEVYPHGQPQRIIFSEQLKDGPEVPLKQIQYYEDGKIFNETDLIVVEEGSKAFELWKSTMVPHGPSVTFFQNGQVEKVSYYDHGVLQGEAKVFYPDGKPRSVVNFDQGMRHGPYCSYYEEGAKAEEATFDKDKIVGELIRYYPNEMHSSLIPYENGVPHGKAFEWYESGALKNCRHFFQGLLHSDGKNPAVVFYDEQRNLIETQDFHQGQPINTHYQYYPDGRTSHSLSFKDGKKEGLEQYFSKQGKVIGEGKYKNGIKIGKHWKNHENGKPAFAALYDLEGNLLEPIVEYGEEGQKIAEYFIAGDKREGAFKEWYPNGQLKLDYYYAKGAFQGPQKEYFPNGALKMQTFFEAEVKDGIYEEWNENGKLLLRLEFKKGLKNGPFIKNFESGAVETKAFYVDDELHGEKEDWHENGTLKFKGKFKEGKKEDWHREYREGGELFTEVFYINDMPEGLARIFHAGNKIKESVQFSKGKREGKSEEFYENGKVRAIAFYKDDKLDGKVEAWHEDGSIYFIKNYKDGQPAGEHKEYFPIDPEHKTEQGKLARAFFFNNGGALDGEQRTFYPSGELQSLVQYKNGTLHGKKLLWDENGESLEEAFYEDGKLNGRFFEKRPDKREIVFHYKNDMREGLHEMYYPPHQFFGKVKALEVPFKDNQPEGEAIEFNEAGVKISTTFFHNGKKEGTSKMFNSNGTLFMTLEFKQDKREGPAIQYFPNGKVFKEVSFQNDEKEGEERTYFDNGKLAAKTFYKNGKQNGLYQEWNQQGVLVFEGEFKDGLRHGKFNKYYDDGKPKLLQVYIEDKLHGTKKSFDPKGMIVETHYNMGKKVVN
ncbi:MAG TPA: hypothetical protein VLG76_06245 [Rhabdochlamydiaceae bacterium]|nr:hypothetical protein [Rhabdochlamydiaceae bacterium]